MELFEFNSNEYRYLKQTYGSGFRSRATDQDPDGSGSHVT
jgi:hypothetical protein